MAGLDGTSKRIAHIPPLPLAFSLLPSSFFFFFFSPLLPGLSTNSLEKFLQFVRKQRRNVIIIRYSERCCARASRFSPGLRNSVLARSLSSSFLHIRFIVPLLPPSLSLSSSEVRRYASFPAVLPSSVSSWIQLYRASRRGRKKRRKKERLKAPRRLSLRSGVALPAVRFLHSRASRTVALICGNVSRMF